jgi:hypothetical protein
MGPVAGYWLLVAGWRPGQRLTASNGFLFLNAKRYWFRSVLLLLNQQLATGNMDLLLCNLDPTPILQPLGGI